MTISIMYRAIVIALCCSLATIAACNDNGRSSETQANTTQPAPQTGAGTPPKPGEPPRQEPAELSAKAQAGKDITAENYRQELEALEKEIAASEQPTEGL